MRTGHLRGHQIYYDDPDVWRYVDNNDPTVGSERPCGVCLKVTGSNGYDPCIGEVLGAINACCGHGEDQEAYVQYPDGVRVHGMKAIQVFQRGLTHPRCHATLPTSPIQTIGEVMHVLLLMRHYEDNPENITFLHKAYDVELSSLDNKYVSPPLPDDVQEYFDLEDEAWGELEVLGDQGIKAHIIEIKM